MNMAEFQPGQLVRVLEVGREDGLRPPPRFFGKEGTIQRFAGDPRWASSPFYMVEFVGRPHGDNVFAISRDWLEDVAECDHAEAMV